MRRCVIHLNVTDFAVAVERVTDRRLTGRPVIVAPEGACRAVVYDMSEEAFQSGVRKGMPLEGARRRCRDAVILAPHMARYEQAMEDMLRRASPYSPLIEPGQADGHLFVDVTGAGRLFGPPRDVAWRMRRCIKRELGLDPIWTLAPNKLVAKVASRLVRPLGQSQVAPGEEAAFLAPLPVWLIPGLERDDLLRLRDVNLTRVSDVGALHADHLGVLFGARAGFIARIMQGRDDAPVLPVGQGPPRVVLDHAFGTDTNDSGRLRRALYGLVEAAGRRLRDQGRAARRVAVGVTHTDGKQCVRQVKVEPATANDFVLFAPASRALDLACHRRVRVRHLRLTCDRLVYPPVQLPLFDEERRVRTLQDRLMSAVDRVRDRFGMEAVKTGRNLAA